MEDKAFTTSERVVKLWTVAVLQRLMPEAGVDDSIFDVIPPDMESIILADDSKQEFKIELCETAEQTYSYPDHLMAAIKFYKRSINIVYTSIVKTLDPVFAETAAEVEIRFDPETNTFFPQFMPQLVRKYEMLRYVKGHMIAKRDGSATWENDYKQLNDDMSKLRSEIEASDITEQMEKRNDDWLSLPRIRIISLPPSTGSQQTGI